MAKRALEEPARDERLRQTVDEVLAARLPQLVARDRQRRAEPPQQTPSGRRRHFPDAEEPQDVVDAERLEVSAHPAKAVGPPAVTVLRHRLPVVRREPPVLPVLGVVVGGGTRLLVHVEEMRLEPGIHRVVVDADRQVALQDHPLGSGVVGCFLQLKVQLVLNKPVEGDAVVKVRVHCCHRLQLLERHAARAEGAPLVVVGGAEEVPKPTEQPVWLQPVRAFHHKLLESLALHRLLPDLLKDSTEVVHFHFHNFFKVNWPIELNVEVRVPLLLFVVVVVVQPLSLFLERALNISGYAFDLGDTEIHGV
mmetsp:Transcript_31256/g.64787  ORF Transcript_31256/g.64787 Transcript_31256/m.64787 type:complete len:308 (-) Transcript_31256:521-1444(-)